MTITAAALLIADTAAQVAAKGLQVAQALGLAASTWRTGDPTKTTFAYIARVLAGDDTDPNEKGLGGIILGYGRAAFLSTALGDWLTVKASEDFGVDRTLATFAAPTVTLRNTGGGLYVVDPGDITVQYSVSGQTYHTTSGPLNPTTLAPLPALSAGVTALFTLAADVAGSAGTVSANQIDTMVTTLNGVVIVSSTAAVGIDQQSDPELVTQCISTLGALSPDGPADAYEYVLRNPVLTGTTEIVRAKAIGDVATGLVTAYVAGASGTVSGGGITAGQNAIETWATPLCITPTVANGTPITINVTATIHGSNIPSTFLTLIQAALGAAITAFDIADTGGLTVDTTFLTGIIRGAIPTAGPTLVVTMTVPAAPVVLTLGQFPVLGTVSITQV